MPTPSCATQPGVAVRSPVVGLLPPRLEWEVNPPRTAGHAYLLGGRIRVLGMRSTQSHPRLVPAAVARLMETAPHSGQRNGASGSRGGCVGTFQNQNLCLGRCVQLRWGYVCLGRMGVVVRYKGNHKYLIMTYHRGGNRQSSCIFPYPHNSDCVFNCH